MDQNLPLTWKTSTRSHGPLSIEQTQRSSTERYNWNKALKAASLPPVTIHSARHWTASMTARANMPDDARTAIMGHTSITMTNHYTHRDTASLAALLDQAIPDLHDDTDIIEAEIIEETA